MPIDYFSKNTDYSSNKRFGLCDDSTDGKEQDPAYIDNDFANEDHWIGKVNNPQEIKVQFNPIDNCVDIFDIDNPRKRSRRCDCLLSYNKKLIFVELKERGKGRWVRDAKKQLADTYRRFKKENDITMYESIEAQACNRLRPIMNKTRTTSLQEFKDKVGIRIKIQQEIDIK